jgi:hypothetical protein
MLRNGLAHEYIPKVGSKVWFYFEPQEGFGFGEENEHPLVQPLEPRRATGGRGVWE